MTTEYTGEAVRKSISVPVHGRIELTVKGVSQPGAGNGAYKGVSTDHAPAAEPTVYVITYDEPVVAPKAKAKAA